MNDLNFAHHFLAAQNSRSAPTLLLLHGTGGDENSLLQIGRDLAPDANLLSPRGKVLENGMPRFFRRLREGVFDEDDLILRAAQLAKFIADAAQCYGFKAKNVIAIGYSNGANIAAALLILQPHVLRAAILLRAMTPLLPEIQPDLKGVEILLASGERDTMVPNENVQTLAQMLREAGANVTHNWQSAGHELAREEILVARDWLEANCRDAEAQGKQ